MDTGFLTRRLGGSPEGRLYGLYLPSDFDPSRAWPVVLFLHGAGEGGTDGLLPTEYQLGSAIRRNARAFPGIVVFPQVQQRQWIWTSGDVDDAMNVLAEVMRDLPIDHERVYISGVSTGGKAAWHALYRHPELFAAGLIVCGVVRPRDDQGQFVHDPDPVVPDSDGDPATALARRLTDIPLWVFHGDDDPVFPVSDARALTDALRSAGAPVVYTELAGFGHDVWDVAYYAPDVAAWLFNQSAGD